MRQKAKELHTTTSRKAHKIARAYSRIHQRGSCPRCGSGRPCFITAAERLGK
jgi:hypothetical protein